MRTLLAVVLAIVVTETTHAGSHLWVISEVFSNFDGTIQFVEMHESAGAANEVAIGSKWISSSSNGTQFVFPSNLPAGSTANQYLLIATAAFAALPGAPTPDHIMPDNFFSTTSDTIQFWLYATSPLSFSAGGLPLDGVSSWNRGPTGMPAFATANSPTNFAGVTGSVDAGGPTSPDFVRCDANADAQFNIADAVAILGFLFSGSSVDCQAALDCNDDSQANIADAVAALDSLFGGGGNPMPPFPSCGTDPTLGGSLTCLAFAACP